MKSLILAVALFCAPAAHSDTSASIEATASKKKASKPKPKPKPKPAGPVAIPIDVGVGPIALIPTGSAFWDQFVHTGLTLSLAAVIDKELIEKNRSRVPAEWRDQVSRVNEARIRPIWLAFIPEVLIISPAWLHTGMYGAIWRPIGLGLTFLEKPVSLSAHASLDLAYVFIHSDAIPQPTHFLRPGINLDTVCEIPLGETFLVSTGWSSTFFVPQPTGRPPWEFWPLQDSLWHLGGPFLKLHVRIPYEVNL